MDNRGLLFIPDISGFTRFVNEIEIDHSRHIIQQLLEVLVNANEIGLEISEIEGDAILFYKYGEPVELEALYGQVEKMFSAFHQHLNSYDHRKICQCKACVSAIDLSLKVITHYGEFTSYNVKQFDKLIGRDVIIAHQLLKNDIDQHEYWLVTSGLLPDGKPVQFRQWMQWTPSTKQTDAGEIPFIYTQLTRLKDEIPKYSEPNLELSSKIKMLSVSREYPVDVKTLCYTVVHFEFRHMWYVGVKTIDEVEHFLPGIGSRHRHVLDSGEPVMKYTSSFVYDPDAQTVFSETDEKKKSSVYFIIEKVAEGRSQLTLELYIPRNPVRQLLFRLQKEAGIENSFQNRCNALKR